MSGYYNRKESFKNRNFRDGSSHLDRLSRQNQRFQKQQEQRKAQIDARAEIISDAGVEEALPAIKAFSPEMQAYTAELWQKYNLNNNLAKIDIKVADVKLENLFDEHEEKTTVFARKTNTSKATEQKVRRIIKEASEEGQESTASWFNKILEKLKKENIGITETFMDRAMDFLANNRMLKPATAFAVVFTLILTSCSGIEASEVPNETEPRITAQVPDVEEDVIYTDLPPAEEIANNEDPGDPTEEARATEEALLSQAELLEMVNSNYEEQNIDATEQEASQLAEMLFAVGDISRNTDWDQERNETSGRDFVRLNEASVYGPYGAYITRGKNGENVYITGQTIGITDMDQIDVTTTDYVAVAKNEAGQTMVVDGETFQWVSIFEGAKDQYEAPTESEAETENEAGAGAELSAEEIAGYDNALEMHWDEKASQSSEIYQEMDIARALVNEEIEYNFDWSEKKKENIAFAVAIYQESQRGAVPITYTREGIQNFYNLDVKNAENFEGMWEEHESNNTAVKFATDNIYYPTKFYENGTVAIYHEGRWIRSNGSFDYEKYIDQSNYTDGTIDFTNERFTKRVENGKRKYVPMICIDDEIPEREIVPLEKEGNIVFYSQFDFALVNPDQFYSVKVKLLSSGTTTIFYPNTTTENDFKSVQYIIRDFDGLLKEGNTYYIAISGDFDFDLEMLNYAKFIIDNHINPNLLFNEDNTFWQNLNHSSIFSVKPLNIYDPN